MLLIGHHINGSSPKELEKHGCVLSTVATDALVLKHQAICIHITDKMLMYWTGFIPKYYIKSENYKIKNILQNQFY